MEFETKTPSLHVESGKLGSLMRDVLIALVPGTLLMIWFFGWGTISNLVLAIGFALGFEALMLRLRQRPIAPFLQDYSAVVTAWLLALTMPAFAPWWLILIAIFFAIVIAKQLYGGLGYNPFNPAMVGYAVVLISFPVEMVNWFAPTGFSMGQIGLVDTLNIVFGNAASSGNWDAMTMATPLDSIKTGLTMDKPLGELSQGSAFGLIAGYGWEWVNLAYLLGGLWMLYRKVISWHIPASFLAGATIFSGVFWLYDSTAFMSPLFHLLAGGTMLGAFFIATDPVSASTTNLGKIIYAMGIAFFLYLIRVWGSGYPDGVAFAVLIMNMAVPLIDFYTRPRAFNMGWFK